MDEATASIDENTDRII